MIIGAQNLILYTMIIIIALHMYGLLNYIGLDVSPLKRERDILTQSRSFAYNEKLLGYNIWFLPIFVLC